MRLTLRAAAIVAGFLLCVPLHCLWRRLGLRSRWGRRLLAWVGWSAGLRARVSGTPLPGRVLFVGNHLSWLDIMLVAGTSGAAFVSKDDVARWPLVGWLARLHDTVFVARTARHAVRGQADALRAALVEGRPVALFPEGTTDGGAVVLPFRASLLAALFPPIEGVKVQPIAIDYGPLAREIAWVGEEDARANVRRILSRPGTIPVDISFLAPIDPASAGDRKALARAARAEILAILGATPDTTTPGGDPHPSAARPDRL